MKKPIIWWALKDKKGNLWEFTIAQTKIDCWQRAWREILEDFGIEWGNKYWHRYDASMKAAERKGYTFCRVRIEEVKK